MMIQIMLVVFNYINIYFISFLVDSDNLDEIEVKNDKKKIKYANAKLVNYSHTNSNNNSSPISQMYNNRSISQTFSNSSFTNKYNFINNYPQSTAINSLNEYDDDLELIDDDQPLTVFNNNYVKTDERIKHELKRSVFKLNEALISQQYDGNLFIYILCYYRLQRYS